MLLTIGDAANVPEYIDARLKKKETIMGFGHRVYKNGDPRVPVLKALCQALSEKKNEKKIFETAIAVEAEMLKRKRLHANVDYYSGLAFYLLGLSAEIYTCIFAMARAAGYLAHIAEQLEENKLIRPRGVYTGKRGLVYKPLASR
jgi:citrate synthase